MSLTVGRSEVAPIWRPSGIFYPSYKHCSTNLNQVAFVYEWGTKQKYASGKSASRMWLCHSVRIIKLLVKFEALIHVTWSGIRQFAYSNWLQDGFCKLNLDKTGNDIHNYLKPCLKRHSLSHLKMFYLKSLLSPLVFSDCTWLCVVLTGEGLLCGWGLKLGLGLRLALGLR